MISASQANSKSWITRNANLKERVNQFLRRCESAINLATKKGLYHTELTDSWLEDKEFRKCIEENLKIHGYKIKKYAGDSGVQIEW